MKFQFYSDEEARKKRVDAYLEKCVADPETSGSNEYTKNTSALMQIITEIKAVKDPNEQVALFSRRAHRTYNDYSLSVADQLRDFLYWSWHNNPEPFRKAFEGLPQEAQEKLFDLCRADICFTGRIVIADDCVNAALDGFNRLSTKYKVAKMGHMECGRKAWESILENLPNAEAITLLSQYRPAVSMKFMNHFLQKLSPDEKFTLLSTDISEGVEHEHYLHSLLRHDAYNNGDKLENIFDGLSTEQRVELCALEHWVDGKEEGEIARKGTTIDCLVGRHNYIRNKALFKEVFEYSPMTVRLELQQKLGEETMQEIFGKTGITFKKETKDGGELRLDVDGNTKTLTRVYADGSQLITDKITATPGTEEKDRIIETNKPKGEEAITRKWAEVMVNADGSKEMQELVR